MYPGSPLNVALLPQMLYLILILVYIHWVGALRVEVHGQVDELAVIINVHVALQFAMKDDA